MRICHQTRIVISLLIICTFSSSVFSQKDSLQRSALIPGAGDVGVTLNLTGLIDDIKLNSRNDGLGNNILFARYYLDNLHALRFGFGLNLQSDKITGGDSIGSFYQTTDSTYSKYTLSFAIGGEKHIITSSRLDPYLFSQLSLIFIGKEKGEYERVNTSGSNQETFKRTTKNDGGLGFSLSAGGGMNYFIASNFSIGTELGLAFTFSKVGGNRTINEVDRDFSGNTITVRESFELEERNASVQVDPSAVINISYFF